MVAWTYQKLVARCITEPHRLERKKESAHHWMIFGAQVTSITTRPSAGMNRVSGGGGSKQGICTREWSSRDFLFPAGFQTLLRRISTALCRLYQLQLYDALRRSADHSYCSQRMITLGRGSG